MTLKIGTVNIPKIRADDISRQIQLSALEEKITENINDIVSDITRIVTSDLNCTEFPDPKKILLRH